MRLFQNFGLMQAYLPRLRGLRRSASNFDDQRRIFLADRFGCSHLLKPVLDGQADTFLTNGNDETLQRAWAGEQGLKVGLPLEDILLAQIEAHRTEVFYNLDPVRYPSSFVAKLPGCVKHKFAWRAAPSGKADFGAYDLILCNFTSIIESYRKIGWRSAYFSPAHDPEMNAYAANRDRPIDVLFVGGYSRHHMNRVGILDAVARLRDKYRIAFHLDRSRVTSLADTPFGIIGPLKPYRRPETIRAISAGPIFGRDLYAALSRSKIVLNCAIDMAGPDRGNMRCFEAMGTAALLVSDRGNYPPGMVDGETMRLYDSAEVAARVISEALADGSWRETAAKGYEMIKSVYSKELQFRSFMGLVFP
jgi:hypothetical protein